MQAEGGSYIHSMYSWNGIDKIASESRHYNYSYGCNDFCFQLIGSCPLVIRSTPRNADRLV